MAIKKYEIKETKKKLMQVNGEKTMHFICQVIFLELIMTMVVQKMIKQEEKMYKYLETRVKMERVCYEQYNFGNLILFNK